MGTFRCLSFPCLFYHFCLTNWKYCKQLRVLPAFESILSLPDFDLFLIDPHIFLAEGLLQQSSIYLCASASAWLIFFSLSCRWLLLILKRKNLPVSVPQSSFYSHSFQKHTKSSSNLFYIMVSLFKKSKFTWRPKSHVASNLHRATGFRAY